MKRVLIIKLGYSETLDSALSLTTSLGDVLRTTVILHFFRDCRVFWLVEEKAAPLLADNPYIYEVLVYSPEIIERLRRERFDVIVNLEKLPEVCSLSDSLRAQEYYGFTFNGSGMEVHNGSSGGKRLVELSQDIAKRKENRDCWQQVLAEAMDRQWHGEEYVLGYRPENRIRHDIGFNWTTGNKWRNKTWPRGYWEDLEAMLKGRYSVSWQEGLESLREYIDWINSCRLIVTADTLGLHVSLALKKRVIALFGPTSHSEIHFYGCGSCLLPESPYTCIPCFKPDCDKERQCMEFISPQRVRERIDDELTNAAAASQL